MARYTDAEHKREYPRVKYDYGKPMGDAILDNILRAPKYESPISIIQKEINTKIEDDVCKAVFEYGISIDKEELIKALRYDREQYEKGYADGCMGGKTALKVEVAREIFEEIEKLTFSFGYGVRGDHTVAHTRTVDDDLLAVLKKKYTGEDEGGAE